MKMPLMKSFGQQLKFKWIASATLTFAILLHIFNPEPSMSAPQESPPQSWQLSTDDTGMTITVVNGRPAITSLMNPTQGWNWTPTPATFPLLERVAVGNSDARQTPNWTYCDATVDESTGRKLTLRFTSSTPKLELKSIWWARKGPGPIEQWMTIQNQTGNPLTINGQDVVSANLPVAADHPLTLWRFSKTCRGGGTDANGVCKTDVGVFKDTLAPNAVIHSAFGQFGDLNADGELPFEMFDVGATHGLYIGYDFGYGKFVNTAAQDPFNINSLFYLDDGEYIRVEKDVVFKVPGIFIGAYKGDTDDGSNHMKRWFWNYRISPYAKDPNEPLIELCSDGTERDVDKLIELLKSHDFSSWGVGVFKVDAWYAGDIRFCEPGTQPYRRVDELAAAVHSRKLRLSVWQPDVIPEAHLLARYDKWHFDYYRSDQDHTHPADYWGYVNFWQKLDNIMAARPGFRWENCMNGGSLKSFNDFQRMSFMTTTDTPHALDFKKALYPNSYMINPVQLKSDCFCGNTFDLRCAMMGCILTGVPEQMNCNEDDMKKSFLLYNTRQAPIVRGADIYHILPMPDGKNWDGLEYFNPAIKKGSVFLFKPTDAGGDSQTIKLKGLDRNTTYALSFEDRPGQNARKTGADLMDKGLPVTMTGKYVSEIVWIE